MSKKVQDKSARNAKFLQVLENWQARRSFTDEDAARLLKCGPTYLSKIRNGSANASRKLLIRLEILQQEDSIKAEFPWMTETDKQRAVMYSIILEITLEQFAVECMARYGTQAFQALKIEQDARTASTKTSSVGIAKPRGEVSKIARDAGLKAVAGLPGQSPQAHEPSGKTSPKAKDDRKDQGGRR